MGVPEFGMINSELFNSPVICGHTAKSESRTGGSGLRTGMAVFRLLSCVLDIGYPGAMLAESV